MPKLPYFAFYPADWRKDPGVQSLTFHDRGVWFEMLCLMHESDQRGKLMLNGKPMPLESLARLLGLEQQVLTNTLTTLLDSGVASRCPRTGALVCRRMVRDEALRQTRRKSGALGGNPLLLNQKPTKVDNPPVIQSPVIVNENGTSSFPSGEGSAEGRGGCPTLEQVKVKAQFIGVPEKEAETFFHHFESAGWIDKNGHPILKWESKLATWKINHQQDRAVAGQKRPPSILDLRTILEAKEYTANELKKNYCSEAALGETWNDQGKFGQWKLLRREIRNLRDTISKSA